MKDNFLHLHGTMSVFGGPDDMGVSPSEGLALCEPSEVDEFPDGLFLDEQPPGTTGLARKLDSEYFYLATRWDYDRTSRDWLQQHQCVVSNPATGKLALAQPIDWGPNEAETGRVADLSPGLAEYLGLKTDDECEVLVPLPRTRPSRPAKPSAPAEVAGDGYKSVVISSGHGLKIRGAAGPKPWGLDEVDTVRKIVEQVAKDLRAKGVEVTTFHDDVSTTQSENLNRITNFHNSKTRQLDISIHLNAYQVTTSKPMGVETLFLTQEKLAKSITDAIVAATGLPNRGPKYRGDLYFLNQTSGPAVLIETLFCDAKIDCDAYRAKFNEICASIAKALTSAEVEV